ncbi:MAG: HAMP domain-containing sensor histidine kinase [Bdellovibrionota bacterium]
MLHLMTIKKIKSLGIDPNKEQFSKDELVSIVQAGIQMDYDTEHNKIIVPFFDTFPGPLYWVNSDLIYLLTNRLVPLAEGSSHKDLIGKIVGETEHDGFLSIALRKFFASNNQVFAWSAKILSNNESRWYQFTACRYNHGEKDTAIVYGFDITAQRDLLLQIEESDRRARNALNRLEKSNAMLSYSRKMEALAEMSDAIAHEINNPLAIINGRFTFMYRKGINDQENFQQKCSQYAKSILNAVRRISVITDSLKIFSNASGSGDIEVINILELINKSVTKFKKTYNSWTKIDVRLKSIKSKILVECKPSQIENAFLRILENSFYAIKDLNESWIEIDFIEQELNFNIKITDSGIRFSDDIADKIFQPFFTTKEVGEGSGLGLNVAKGIIDDHGGEIVFDRDSKNTSFIVTLPKAKRSHIDE